MHAITLLPTVRQFPLDMCMRQKKPKHKYMISETVCKRSGTKSNRIMKYCLPTTLILLRLQRVQKSPGNMRTHECQREQKRMASKPYYNRSELKPHSSLEHKSLMIRTSIRSQGGAVQLNPVECYCWIESAEKSYQDLFQWSEYRYKWGRNL